MRSRAPGIKLTIFVIVTSVATALLAILVGNIRIGPTRTYHADFSNGSGLKPGSDVRIAGVPVGKVSDVAIQDRHSVLITFDVRSDVTLMKGTIAAVKFKNLIGERFLQLSNGPGDVVPLRAGATIPLAQTQPSLDLDQLMNGFRPLLKGLDPDQTNRLAVSLVQVLNGQASSIGELVKQVADLSLALSDRDAAIGSLIDNLNTVLAAFNRNKQQFSTMLDQLQQLVSTLGQDRDRIVGGLASVNDATTAVDGLLQSARPSIHDDISALNTLGSNINARADFVNMVLGKLPSVYKLLGRGSYGSFFNFYLCGIGLAFGTQNHVIVTRAFTMPMTRCQFQ
jgi:phospholipid/cholesterol/gamma-HCH transport system substrate-binding protein